MSVTLEVRPSLVSALDGPGSGVGCGQRSFHQQQGCHVRTRAVWVFPDELLELRGRAFRKPFAHACFLSFRTFGRHGRAQRDRTQCKQQSVTFSHRNPHRAMTLLLAPQDATRLVCLFLNNRLTFAAIHRRLAGLLTKVSCSHSGTLSRPQLNAPPISLRIRKDPSTRSLTPLPLAACSRFGADRRSPIGKSSCRWIPCP